MIPPLTRFAMRPRSWDLQPKPDADPLLWTDAAVLVAVLAIALVVVAMGLVSQ